MVIGNQESFVYIHIKYVKLTIHSGLILPISRSSISSTTPSTTPSGTRPNVAHSRLDLTRNNWEEMISKSVMSRWPMSSRRADLTRRKFNRICDRVKTRHDKMTEAGCYFELADEIIFDAVLINFKDTCETTSKLIQGI